MRIRNTLFLAAAAMAMATAASAAAPVVSLSNVGDPNTLPIGQQLVADFNDAANPEGVLQFGFDLDLLGATVGVNEGASGYSGNLPNDPTHYLTVPGGATAILSSIRALTSFSLYMGSPDTYNSIRFIGDNGYDFTLTGAQISDGYVGQSWGWGTRINFDFGGANVKQVVLKSARNSFESDNFAAGVVPEPATWALMLSGFGGAGAMLRRRRTASALA
jgi:hypothetical protein